MFTSIRVSDAVALQRPQFCSVTQRFFDCNSADGLVQYCARTGAVVTQCERPESAEELLILPSDTSSRPMVAARGAGDAFHLYAVADDCGGRAAAEWTPTLTIPAASGRAEDKEEKLAGEVCLLPNATSPELSALLVQRWILETMTGCDVDLR